MFNHMHVYYDESDEVLRHMDCGGEIRATTDEVMYQRAIEFEPGTEGCWRIGEGLWVDLLDSDDGESNLLYVECDRCGRHAPEARLTKEE